MSYCTFCRAKFQQVLPPHDQSLGNYNIDRGNLLIKGYDSSCKYVHIENKYLDAYECICNLCLIECISLVKLMMFWPTSSVLFQQLVNLLGVSD